MLGNAGTKILDSWVRAQRLSAKAAVSQETKVAGETLH
jgi:hypothetical protein